IGRPGVLVAPAHLRQRGIPLFRRRKPMNPVPLGSEQLAEGIPGGKAHPHPVGAELLDRRDTEVLRLADSHGGAKLTGWGGGGASGWIALWSPSCALSPAGCRRGPCPPFGGLS